MTPNIDQIERHIERCLAAGMRNAARAYCERHGVWLYLVHEAGNPEPIKVAGYCIEDAIYAVAHDWMEHTLPERYASVHKWFNAECRVTGAILEQEFGVEPDEPLPVHDFGVASTKASVNPPCLGSVSLKNGWYEVCRLSGWYRVTEWDPIHHDHEGAAARVRYVPPDEASLAWVASKPLRDWTFGNGKLLVGV